MFKKLSEFLEVSNADPASLVQRSVIPACKDSWPAEQPKFPKTQLVTVPTGTNEELLVPPTTRPQNRPSDHLRYEKVFYFQIKPLKYLGFLMPLITNMRSNWKNAKWRTQYDEKI